MLLDVARRIPDGSTIEIAPVLHQFQALDLQSQSPVLNRHGLTVRPWEPDHDNGKYLLVFHRRADMPGRAELEAAGWKLQIGTHRQGTLLSSFYMREKKAASR